MVNTSFASALYLCIVVGLKGPKGNQMTPVHLMSYCVHRSMTVETDWL